MNHPDGDSRDLLESIVDRVNVGVLVVDAHYTVVRWNRFMAMHSGLAADDVLGRDLFTVFPDLPRRWLTQKLRGVFLLKNYAFTSWEQRPYLFRFPHNRPATTAVVDCMRQDCTFIPIKDGDNHVTHVCITIMDATDTCIYQIQLREAMDSLEKSSARDPLTGIFNRGHIESRLRDEFARSHRHDSDLSVILFDIDHFKRVNDLHGHMAGDEVLCEVANRVAGALRKEDVFGRYGGEEFTVVLPDSDLAAARVVAERLRHCIAARPIVTSAGAVDVTVTLGVCRRHPDIATHETLLNRADQALYRGKAGGRNGVFLYEDEA
ncbi:diguanylate cyclase [Aquisalimonas lutea]|uniref:sensor domain-containing diguanylate cyclase n=1 Tax=Aquisalimonas lutea TaxID=1327750 RepID=UPI0025B37F74|nr:diguanylate cyclase [Aquisalimonas lutea]MDN3518868.1 diguanylate cyclase [Aquisalimonas lutea]